MAEHNELGEKGEAIALNYLVKNDYEILDKNYRFRKGEIDIIAFKNNFIIFVEVKTRQSKDLMGPQESVTKTKQRQIIKTAHQFIIENDYDYEGRFDIIGIVTNQYTTDIEHIEEAFYPMIS